MGIEFKHDIINVVISLCPKLFENILNSAAMHYKSEAGFQKCLPIYQTYRYLNARYFMYNGVTGNAKDFRKNPQILCKCLFEH